MPPKLVKKRCTSCELTLPATTEFFYKKGKGLRATCKRCSNACGRKWRANNAKKCNIRVKRWRRENPERVSTANKIWGKNNIRSKTLTKRKLCRSRKITVVNHYSNGTNTCKQCSENDMDVLTIQHIGGGGTAHRKKIGGNSRLHKWLIDNHLPEGFEILCMGCNQKDHVVRCKENRKIPWSAQVIRNDKLKIKAFDKYGSKCCKCGECDYDKLTFDHIEDGGSEDRRQNRKLNYNWLVKGPVRNDLQLLCANCNLKKEILRISINIEKRLVNLEGSMNNEKVNFNNDHTGNVTFWL